MNRWIPGGKPRKAMTPDGYKVKNAIYPLQLKDSVKGNVGTTKYTPCINELLEMLDCLKRSGFTDTPCKPVIKAYADCNVTHNARLKEREQRAEEDLLLINNPRDMRRAQIRQLLKNFPNK